MDDFLTIAIIILAFLFIALLLLLAERTLRLKKMKKSFEVGKKIASNIKIRNLIREIIEIAKQETGAEASTLYLVDEEKQELWFEVSLGGKSDKLKEMRIKIGEGSIAGWVAKEGKTLNIKDVNKDPRFMKSLAKRIDYKQKAMLTMPVENKGKIIGVLQIINKKNGRYFTQADEEFLSALSDQVAIALENAKLYEEMNLLFLDSIMSLAGAIDAKDPYTNGHSRRVMDYSLALGRAMDLDEEQLEKLEYAAILHDIGKIGIRDSILNKQEKLTDEEFDIMKTHTTIGYKILDNAKSLKGLSSGARFHHERFDGTGYTEKIKGKEIPLEARIIAVADTFDAMTTDRPYRKGLPGKVASQEIIKNSGTQFDPEVVEGFIKTGGFKELFTDQAPAL